MIEPNHIYTLEEYWKLVEIFPDCKYEYADGHIRMMSRGSPAHAELGLAVGSLLRTTLRQNGSECHAYNSDVTVLLENRKVYHPDVAVSCDPYDWTRRDGLESPTVVVEILSPWTEHIDKTEKLEAYQRYPAIQEILYVDSRKRWITHYHRTGAYSWETCLYEHDDDTLYLPSIEVQLSVRDIYDGIYLELEEGNL